MLGGMTQTNGRLSVAPSGRDCRHSMSDEDIRKQIKEFDCWFVNTNFGNGIIARSTCWPDEPMLSRHAGVGKFEFIIERNLPDIQGKRILEIGCNAGVISIHMARLGAAEVVGIDCERTWPRWREQAQFVKEALEWRCQTRYNVRYVECDMVDLPDTELGQFDAVLALNCIYYVEQHEIRRLCQHVSGITNHFVVQSNTGDHKGLRSRTRPAFLREAMIHGGFDQVFVDWPWDRPRKGIVPRRYSRPVLVGTKYPPGREA